MGPSSSVQPQVPGSVRVTEGGIAWYPNNQFLNFPGSRDTYPHTFMWDEDPETGTMGGGG